MGKKGALIGEDIEKAIFQLYAESGNYSDVARQLGVSPNTVKNHIEKPKNAAFAEECKRKANERTEDILAHMEKKRDIVNQIIDTYLEKLLDPMLIERSTTSQLTTALGTLVDKFTMSNAKAGTTQREDDPLSKSLKEEAERMNNGNLS